MPKSEPNLLALYAEIILNLGFKGLVWGLEIDQKLRALDAFPGYLD